MRMFTTNPATKWLIYGFGWLSLALTLPVALALIASFLSFAAQSDLPDQLRLVFPFAALPFAGVRVAIWLVDKKCRSRIHWTAGPTPSLSFP